jgi:hypothetical protein
MQSITNEQSTLEELLDVLALLRTAGVTLTMEADDEDDQDEGDESDDDTGDEGESDKDKPKSKEKDPAVDAAKWKALARKHEARAKENAEKARKFDEVELAGKTEAERLAARAEAAEKKAAELELRTLRNEIGSEVGLPRTMWSRLQGATEDEIREDAEALAEDLKPATGDKKTDEKPAGKPGAGARGKPPTGDDDGDIEAELKRYRERRG